MELQDLVENEIEKLKDRKDVKAVFIVGSYARDPKSEHNDIDLFVIVNEDWRKRETQLVKGKVIEKFFNSEKWVEKYLDQRDWWKNYHWFKNADVKYDPQNMIADIREKLDEQKQSYLESELDHEEIKYHIWDYKQDIKTKDVGQKRYMMYELFDYLLDTQYKLKKEIPVKSNYKIKRLKEFDGYMYKLAQEFLNTSSTMKKEQKLDKMIEHVTRGIGTPSPEWETSKEKFKNKN